MRTKLKKSIKKSIVLALVTLLAMPPALLAGSSESGYSTGYYEEQGDPSAAAMAVDAIALRPLGLVATVLGAGLFVVSLPFSALGGNVEEAADTLIGDPARVTFQRPLGEFDFRY